MGIFKTGDVAQENVKALHHKYHITIDGARVREINIHTNKK